MSFKSDIQIAREAQKKPIMEIGIHHALSSSDIRRKKGPEVTSFQALLPVLPKVERDQRIICGLTSGGVASFPAAPGSEN